MRRLLLVMVFLAACSTATKTPAVDGGAPATDSGVVSDAGALDAGALDAGSDAGASPDAGDEIDAGVEDAGIEVDAGAVDAGAPDASVDAGPVNTNSGQCGTNADCPTNNCTLRTPGGFCAACGDDSDCPNSGGVTYTCNSFGTCNQDCDSDVDCPIGLHCHSTQFLCVLKSCGTCPAPYVCDNGYCSRPPCDANCPSGKCNGGYCVVDR